MSTSKDPYAPGQTRASMVQASMAPVQNNQPAIQPAVAPKPSSPTAPTTPSMKPVMGSVNPEQTVAGQMSKLLSENSDYMKAARSNARLESHSRGMLNSSIMAGASQKAAIESALPIAQQDASTFHDQSTRNQDASNLFIRDENQHRRSVDMQSRQFGHESAMQDDVQDFQAQENESDRAHQSQMQNDAQDFQAQENVLGRLHQATMQDDSQAHASRESLAERGHQYSMQKSAEKHDLAMQDDQQKHQSDVLTSEQRHQASIQNDQQAHEANQEALNRSQELAVLNDQQMHEITKLDSQLANDLTKLNAQIEAQLEETSMNLDVQMRGTYMQMAQKINEGYQKEVQVILNNPDIADKATEISASARRFSASNWWMGNLYRDLGTVTPPTVEA